MKAGFLKKSCKHISKWPRHGNDIDPNIGLFV